MKIIAIFILVGILSILVNPCSMASPNSLSSQTIAASPPQSKGFLDSESMALAKRKIKDICVVLIFIVGFFLLWIIDHYLFEFVKLRVKNFLNNRHIKKQNKLFNNGKISGEEVLQGYLRRSIMKAQLGKKEGITEIKSIMEQKVLNDNTVKELLRIVMKYSPQDSSFEDIMAIICGSFNAKKFKARQ